MKSSQYIIFHWLYTIILINIFYWFFFPTAIMWFWAYRSSMFFMLLLVPLLVKFVFDDVEDEYKEMWYQLRNNGRIR